MRDGTKAGHDQEFNFYRGTVVATFCGFIGACFAFGLAAAKPIAAASAAAGTTPLWTGLPKLVVVLLGGFTTNFIWCVILQFQTARAMNTSAQLYAAAPTTATTKPSWRLPSMRPAKKWLRRAAGTKRSGDGHIPLLNNYAFSAFAGTIWYMQFFFYTMGETQMGKYGFASWTLPHGQHHYLQHRVGRVL